MKSPALRGNVKSMTRIQISNGGRIRPKYITIPHAELSFFAVSLNLCYCLKHSPITVDFLQAVQQNDGRKSKGFPFFSNKCLKNAFGSP